MSTFPLADLGAIELPFEASREVTVVATIRGPGGERMRVASVHVDLSSTLARTLISGKRGTRLRQAMGLAEDAGIHGELDHDRGRRLQHTSRRANRR